MLSGYPPLKLINYIPGTTNNEAVDNHIRDRATILQTLKVNLQVAQNRQKAQVDCKRKYVEFHDGEWVYLKLQPYR